MVRMELLLRKLSHNPFYPLISHSYVRHELDSPIPCRDPHESDPAERLSPKLICIEVAGSLPKIELRKGGASKVHNFAD